MLHSVSRLLEPTPSPGHGVHPVCETFGPDVKQINSERNCCSSNKSADNMDINPWTTMEHTTQLDMCSQILSHLMTPLCQVNCSPSALHTLSDTYERYSKNLALNAPPISAMVPDFWSQYLCSMAHQVATLHGDLLGNASEHISINPEWKNVNRFELNSVNSGEHNHPQILESPSWKCFLDFVKAPHTNYRSFMVDQNLGLRTFKGQSTPTVQGTFSPLAEKSLETDDSVPVNLSSQILRDNVMLTADHKSAGESAYAARQNKCKKSCPKSARLKSLLQTDQFVPNNEELKEICEFAHYFKLRRLTLGLTQTQVGCALNSQEGPAYSQSAICRFEKLDVTAKSAKRMKPVLERWLCEAEAAHGNEKNYCDFHLLSHSPRKRKRRTCFSPQALSHLVDQLRRNPYPSKTEMITLSQKLAYDREVIRVWFCNRRQALKSESNSLTSTTSDPNTLTQSGEEGVYMSAGRISHF